MGREARCRAHWGSRKGDITLHLEGAILAVGGTICSRIAVAELLELRVDGECLRFTAGADAVALELAHSLATRWLAALTVTPPTLAQKLGIDATTRVARYGKPACEELGAALASASSEAHDPTLVVATIEAADALQRALALHAGTLAGGAPLWVVYRKGRTSPYGETAIRALLRSRGYSDTKVASVSSEWTALRFNHGGNRSAKR